MPGCCWRFLPNCGSVGARGGMGRPAKNLSKQGRFDVVVWGATKPQGSSRSRRGDTRRSSATWSGCATPSRMPRGYTGLVANLYAWGDGEEKDGKDRVSDRVKSIADRAEQLVCRRDMHFERHRGIPRVRKGGAWTVEVLEVRRRA